jgi:hypothetical protein
MFTRLLTRLRLWRAERRLRRTERALVAFVRRWRPVVAKYPELQAVMTRAADLMLKIRDEQVATVRALRDTLAALRRTRELRRRVEALRRAG